MENSTSESKYSGIATDELEQLLYRLPKDSEKKLVQAELIRRYRDYYEELSRYGGLTSTSKAPEKPKSPKKKEPTNQPHPSSSSNSSDIIRIIIALLICLIVVIMIITIVPRF